MSRDIAERRAEIISRHRPSRGLQDEPSPPLALLTGHTFVGDAQTVADAATDAARRALSFSEAVVLSAY